MMATQKRGRGAEPPGPPTDEWLEAFEDQLSAKDFMESMRVYARGQAKKVACYRKVDEYYASELVQNVLDETFRRKLTWDPARRDLAQHVMDAVRWRARNDYLRAKRYRHASLDPDEPGTFADVEAELAAQQTRREEHEACRRTTDAILAALRVLAADDPEVLLLIDAYEEQAIKKVDVVQVSGLTSRQYKAARQRLFRLRDQLPKHLLSSASRTS